MITENTAKMGGGAYMSAKLTDILNPQPKEERSAEEIIGGIRRKIEGLK